jgi:PAS domain S-box-containing protein
MSEKGTSDLAQLNDLSLRLWQMADLQQGLDEMLRATMEMLRADMGNVRSYDPQRKVLTITSQRGFKADFLDFFKEVSAEDDSSCGRSLRSGQRTIIEDVQVDPEYEPYRAIAASAGYRGVQSTPLLSRDGRPLGMLSTHFAGPHRPSERELRQLDLYVRQAVSFIERAAMEAALRAEIEAREVSAVVEARLGAIVESSDDAIISKTLDGIIMSWNAGAESLFGFTADEAIGQSILLIIPPDRHQEESTILNKLRNGEKINHFETVRQAKDGTLVEISLSVSPVRDASGTIVGASKIARDITGKRRLEREREQLLEAERAAREEAQRLNRLKDEFLATLSHELRTPLNAILGWAQMMGLGTLKGDDLVEAGHVIERNARTQKQLIDDLLDMSRIVSGKLRLELQQIEPSSIIDTAIETIRPTAAVKDIRIEKLLDPLAGPVSGDPGRLQQVIWNLLANAVKFTPKGGKIQVRLERVNSHIEICISDTGEGIEPAFLPNLFERFRQADASEARRHGGLGLGLAIVKEIVELHGGTVRAKSAGVRQGATFIVTLPLLIFRRKADAPSVHPTAPSALPIQTDFTKLSGLKILFVDDEPDARNLVKRLLEQYGAEVAIAENATVALDRIVHFCPDLLISDIGMPNVDGYEFLRRLRSSRDETAMVPAIALTAFARSEDRTRALLAGYMHHVSKPIEPSELLATIAVVSGRVGDPR